MTYRDIQTPESKLDAAIPWWRRWHAIFMAESRPWIRLVILVLTVVPFAIVTIAISILADRWIDRAFYMIVIIGAYMIPAMLTGATFPHELLKTPTMKALALVWSPVLVAYAIGRLVISLMVAAIRYVRRGPD